MPTGPTINVCGQAGRAVFASSEKARTFDSQAGDVADVPFAKGHHIENTGVDVLVLVELFRRDHFADNR